MSEESVNKEPVVVPMDIEPSLALYNCMVAARQAKLRADEHELVGRSFESIAKLIPGGYKQPAPKVADEQ